MPSGIRNLEDVKSGDVDMVETASQLDQSDSMFRDDEAAQQAYRNILAWSPDQRRQKERSLVRRLDLLICLPVFIMYILNYLDRNSIAQARLSGLVTDTNITENDYALVNGIFYISYIIAQTPSNMILTRTRPSVFLPIVMILWALVSLCTAFCHNLGQLIAVRFILGIVEAPFYPGAVFYLSCWYTREEIGKRISVLVSGICISNACAGLIAAGILGGLEGAHGIRGWQWIFIVEGVATVGVAILVFFIIPDYPSTTKKIFSAENRVLAQLRMLSTAEDRLLDVQKVPLMNALRQAVCDYRTWCFGILQLSITIMLGFNFFFPTLVKGMGFTNNITILLLTVPPYIIAAFASFGLSWNADRTQKRVLHYLIATGVSGVGLVLLVGVSGLGPPGPKYFASFILAIGSFSAYACSYPWLSAIMPQPAEKRAVAIGIANSLSNVGAFASGYIYIAAFGPTYRVSWAISLGFTLVVAIIVIFMYWRLGKRNEELAEVERLYANGTISEEELKTRDYDEQAAAKAGFRMTR